MLVVSLLALLLALSIPAIRKSHFEAREARKTDAEKFDEYLDSFYAYGWDTVQIGTLTPPQHYYEALETVYQIERGIFPAIDYNCDANGMPDAYHQRSFNLYDVDDYIRLRKSWEDHVRRGPFRGYDIQIDRHYDPAFRDELRRGQITIDGKTMPLADAKTYIFNKVSQRMEKLHHFTKNEPDWNTMNTALTGKLVTITDRESPYYGEWGRVQYFDGDAYGIAIADGKTSIPIFDRTQFRVNRYQRRLEK